jgi:hypothetical protein
MGAIARRHSEVSEYTMRLSTVNEQNATLTLTRDGPCTGNSTQWIYRASTDKCTQ